MSTDTEAPVYNKSALEFKSTSFSVPVLAISSTDLKLIEHQLEEKISQAPEFFKNSPILIDLQNCDQNESTIDAKALIIFLLSKNLIPVGINGASPEQNKLALELNIPTHTIRGTASQNSKSSQKLSSKNTDPTDNSPNDKTVNVENMLISHPIRSGQRIYAKGDLTVLSHVSAGAEIMAEGNIHVYGSLRGRALAGVQGNTKSRIFCSNLQAELVSIAGHYKVNEELVKIEQTKPAQIFLQDQALIIKNL